MENIAELKKKIMELNPLAFFSPCGTHTLNLSGVEAAKCCPEAITFFGVVQKCYVIFSSSPQCWEILLSKIGCSLHSTSETRWSAHVAAVKPFTAHLPGLVDAINELLESNIPPETVTDLKGIKTYITSFKGLLMASVWLKILVPINMRNVALQARNTTIDAEVDNIASLLEDLQLLRENWQVILQECRIVANNLGWNSDFPEESRTRSAVSSDLSPEENFKISVFYVILDSVIASIRRHFAATQRLNETFKFLWKYVDMPEDELKEAAGNFQKVYDRDVQTEIVDEIIHLKSIHAANIKENLSSPLLLLNKFAELNLSSLFPNLCIALRIFLTLPVTVASSERSFSVLTRVKSHLRATMGQQRLVNLALLSIENRLARILNYNDIIKDFAQKKARKAAM